MSITSSSILVDMNISVWTAAKVDKEATDKVLVDNYAIKGAAQVKKNLMAGTSSRKQIDYYAAGCRVWHGSRTLPWADNGTRLLPTSLFMDYKAEANVRRATFDKAVSDFLAEYPSLVQQAGNYQGALFDINDYPHVEEVREKFAFRLVFSPLPETGDFRLDLPQQDLEEMKQGYEQAFESRLSDAMRVPWEQMHKMLGGMSERLNESSGETKKRWHDTFITNAQDLCQMLTHLNVAKDPKLEQARRELETVLLGVDIDDIKSDLYVRSHVKEELDAMLKKYEW